MTNMMLWGLAGLIAGWISYSLVGFNKERGLMISLIIGLVGGILGASVIAPMLGTAGAVNAGDFNPFPLFIAFASAVACLIITNMVGKRFGF